MTRIGKKILAAVSAFAVAAGTALSLPSANIEADAYYVWNDIEVEEEVVEEVETFVFDPNNFVLDSDTGVYVYTVKPSKTTKTTSSKSSKKTLKS